MSEFSIQKMLFFVKHCKNLINSDRLTYLSFHQNPSEHSKGQRRSLHVDELFDQSIQLYHSLLEVRLVHF